MGSTPGGGHGNPLQYSCLENHHGQRSLVGYRPRSRNNWSDLVPTPQVQVRGFVLQTPYIFRFISFSFLISHAILLHNCIYIWTNIMYLDIKVISNFPLLHIIPWWTFLCRYFCPNFWFLPQYDRIWENSSQRGGMEIYGKECLLKALENGKPNKKWIVFFF